jgi:hypothetical protein
MILKSNCKPARETVPRALFTPQNRRDPAFMLKFCFLQISGDAIQVRTAKSQLSKHPIDNSASYSSRERAIRSKPDAQ